MSSQYTIEELQQYSEQQLMGLYLSLESPNFEKMHGEFQGHWLNQEAHWFSKWLWRFSTSNWTSGQWLGKSFQPTAANKGWGFNNLRKFGGLVRRWPMHTSNSPSRYDGKDSFSLRYSYYYSPCGLLDVQDEFRQLQDDLCIGLAHYRSIFGLSVKPMWFAMIGPVGPFDSSGLFLK